ncbi:hypothetical protein B0T26DRAFT_360812 [Lasiosphaeria miniovina]|uniref:Uncharacterized protein n=1 Tax=Lasiosphaeria miniovina TaxID=1954250 RepID=A0AA40DTZ3_9PEZI|nr:uncharacterized protein B0T26DRAFT_360812 [Lasiosphaeria miniovina]KAK0713286.1 hypothetical protein B0T26DRAFT_360812 [Lasiosphaeria miniovina]
MQTCIVPPLSHSYTLTHKHSCSILGDSFVLFFSSFFCNLPGAYDLVSLCWIFFFQGHDMGRIAKWGETHKFNLFSLSSMLGPLVVLVFLLARVTHFFSFLLGTLCLCGTFFSFVLSAFSLVPAEAAEFIPARLSTVFVHSFFVFRLLFFIYSWPGSFSFGLPTFLLRLSPGSSFCQKRSAGGRRKGGECLAHHARPLLRTGMFGCEGVWIPNALSRGKTN